jgi:hypothetical protein
VTSLHDLQQAFASAVRFGDVTAVARFVAANGIEPERRVRVYANNVRENFLATLEATYPVLLRLAGRDWFRQTGTAYLKLHPSRSGNLHHVGERFASFLEAHLGDSAYAYFVDVARLEWAYQEVLVADDGGVLDLAALSAVPAERHADLVFELHPAARLVASAFPLLQIWRLNQPDASPDATLDLAAGSSRMLIVRRDSHVELRELPAGEFAFLDAIARRESLLAAATLALAADAQFSLPGTLVRAAQTGVLASFYLRTS